MSMPPVAIEDAALTRLLSRARVLVVDDEAGMRNFLMKTLAPFCQAVEVAGTTAEADAQLDRGNFDIVILDNIMPGLKGLDWLAEQRRRGGFAETIMITAYADLETAIEALRAGASDFVLKPFRSNQLLNAVRRALQMAQLRRENLLLRHELASGDTGPGRRNRLIGSSASIAAVRDMLARVAGVTTPLLITGASGTGKEVAARHLHGISERADRPFVPINCAAIPPDRIEAELFGHIAGALPGIPEGREGFLPSAQGGTVFLDEVAELSPAAQSALLRVVEDGRIRPLGAARDLALDLRFVLASSRPLEPEVAAGRFRQDLFFRINVLQIDMPPLRHRETDVIDLADLFLTEIAQRQSLAPLEMDSTTRAALLRHDWPGNIRELRNFIERALIFGRFPLETLAPPQRQAEAIEPLAAVERRLILRALDLTGGNRSEAARRLGISRKTIDRKCAGWGL